MNDINAPLEILKATNSSTALTLNFKKSLC